MFFFRNSFSQVFLRKQLTPSPWYRHSQVCTYYLPPSPWHGCVLGLWELGEVGPSLPSKLVSNLSLSPFVQNNAVRSLVTHSFIYWFHLYILGFNVYIQDKIYWELFKNRFDLRQSPSPVVEISLLKGKQPETSVKISSISLDCGRPGQGILKII